MFNARCSPDPSTDPSRRGFLTRTAVSSLAIVATAALAGVAASAAQAAGRSTTTIPPGQTFLLGGDQSRPLKVEGRNVGPVSIELLIMSDGKTESVAVVEPGQTFAREFPVGQTVLVRNLSSQQATVSLTLNVSVSSVSMRYSGPGTGR